MSYSLRRELEKQGRLARDTDFAQGVAQALR